EAALNNIQIGSSSFDPSPPTAKTQPCEGFLRCYDFAAIKFTLLCPAHRARRFLFKTPTLLYFAKFGLISLRPPLVSAPCLLNLTGNSVISRADFSIELSSTY